MKSIAVLQVGPLMPTVQESITEEYGAVRLPDDPAGQEEFLRVHGRAFEVAVTSGKFGVGADLMSALPNLRAVINFGVGYDTTDVAQAAERGITVSNTPDVLNDCVADTPSPFTWTSCAGSARLTATSAAATGSAKATSRWPPRPAARRWGSSGWAGSDGSSHAGWKASTATSATTAAIRWTTSLPVYGFPVELAAGCDVLIVAAAGGPGSAKLVGADVIHALGPRAT